MATFNLETSIKIIPEFSGNYKQLNSFLTIVELINNTLEETSKQLLISFVYNVKLTNLVRTSLGISIPTTFQELKEALSNRYKSKRTIPQIQASLSTFTQKNQTVTVYHEKLLELISELNELQIKNIPNCNNIQAETIKQINNDYSLNIFKNGLKGEIKPTVFASRPNNLNDALQLASELEKEFSNNSEQILYFTNKRNNFNQFPNNNYRRNNNFNSKRNNNNNNYTRNFKNRNNNNNWPNNNNNTNNDRSRYNNNRNRQNNNYNSNNNFRPNNNYHNNNYRGNNNHNTQNRENRNNKNIHYVQENCQEPEVN